MRFLKRRAREESEFQMAPMIDIVFLLLVFFICTTAFLKIETELKLALPAEKQVVKPTRPPREFTIELKPDYIAVAGRKITMKDLELMLKQYSRFGKKDLVLISGHPEVYHEKTVAVLNLCTTLGMTNVSIAELPK